jgi:hypothetical protein
MGRGRPGSLANQTLKMMSTFCNFGDVKMSDKTPKKSGHFVTIPFFQDLGIDVFTVNIKVSLF